MTILDRTLDTGRIRIDAARLTDELARRLPDADHFDLAKARETAGVAVHDAADRARESLDQAAELVRDLRSDIAHAVDKVQADGTLDEVGQRLRAVASTTAMRALIAGLDRELPDTDRDRYARAYARGRAQGRSKYLAVGIAAGVTTGIVAAAPARAGTRQGAPRPHRQQGQQPDRRGLHAGREHGEGRPGPGARDRGRARPRQARGGDGRAGDRGRSPENPSPRRSSTPEPSPMPRPRRRRRRADAGGSGVTVTDAPPTA